MTSSTTLFRHSNDVLLFDIFLIKKFPILFLLRQVTSIPRSLSEADPFSISREGTNYSHMHRFAEPKECLNLNDTRCVHDKLFVFPSFEPHQCGHIATYADCSAFRLDYISLSIRFATSASASWYETPIFAAIAKIVGFCAGALVPLRISHCVVPDS